MDKNISIILPVYNCEKYIDNAIMSVINQTYSKWELIIINDGSTDNTLNVCEKYLSDERIKIVNKKNEGPSAARNLGIRNARGNYIMFIDSDDTYSPEMLEKMYNNIKEFQLVCCNNYKIQKNKKEGNNLNSNITTNDRGLKNFIEILQINRKFNVVWNKMYIKDIIIKNSIFFNESINLGEDYEFNVEYCKYIEKAIFIKDYLYNYNIFSNSISSNYRKDEFEIRFNNVKKNEKLYDEKKYSKEIVYQKYIEVLIQSAISLIEKNKSMALKEKKRTIMEYSKIIADTVNCDWNLYNTLEDKIIIFFLKEHLYNYIYYYIKLRIKIKKIMYAIKGKVYR